MPRSFSRPSEKLENAVKFPFQGLLFLSFFLSLIPRPACWFATVRGSMMIFTGQVVGEISEHRGKLRSFTVISTLSCIRLKARDDKGGSTLKASALPSHFPLFSAYFHAANFFPSNSPARRSFLTSSWEIFWTVLHNWRIYFFFITERRKLKFVFFFYESLLTRWPLW